MDRLLRIAPDFNPVHGSSFGKHDAVFFITFRRCRILRVSPVRGRPARRVVAYQCSAWAAVGMALRIT